MIWFLLGLVLFVILLTLVYRWASGKATKGAFRGQGRFGGAGVVEKFREDDPQAGSPDDRG